MSYLVTTIYKKGKGTEWATGQIFKTKTLANKFAKVLKTSKKVKEVKVRGIVFA